MSSTCFVEGGRTPLAALGPSYLEADETDETLTHVHITHRTQKHPLLQKVFLAKWKHVKKMFCLKLPMFFLKIKMKRFQWEKIEQSVFKWVFVLFSLFFLLQKEKQRRPFGGKKSIPSLMGWLSPCLHRLMLLCSQPHFLAFQLSWCLRGCLLAPSHWAQTRKAAHCPPFSTSSWQGTKTPLHTEQNTYIPRNLPYPLEKYQNKHFVTISGQFFSSLLQPIYIQCCTEGLPGWQARGESSLPKWFAMAPFALDKSLRHDSSKAKGRKLFCMSNSTYLTRVVG